MPSLARSVPKPLKVPSLARSVHKPLSIFGRSRRAPAVVTAIAVDPLPAGRRQRGTRVRLPKVNRRQRCTRVRLLKVNRRQRGTRYDSPKLIVGSEVRGTTPQS